VIAALHTGVPRIVSGREGRAFRDGSAPRALASFGHAAIVVSSVMNPAIHLRRFALLSCALVLGACSRARVTTQPEPVREAPAPPAEAALPLTPTAALAAKGLIIPVEGVDASRIRDSYTASRGGRTHDAVDIMAARGTPVIAADSGTILKLRQNEAGGITIYQLDPAERFVYYYAHLDRYRDGLAEGQAIRQGEVLGFVGTTGNSPKNLPHLHFQVMLYRGRGQYWGGEPINPHPYFIRRN
jgi:murein DD-endopeptidase MepM/ murein hydrolase activator NlpD